MNRLFIEPTVPESAERYRQLADTWNMTPPHERSSGFDLICYPFDSADWIRLETPQTCLISQGCRVLATDDAGRPIAWWLAPRSSISKTPWRLANSIGLIDATYRGTVKAALDSLADGPDTVLRLGSAGTAGLRLVQAVAPGLTPWAEVIVVDTLPAPDTTRGAGGFGSTGS